MRNFLDRHLSDSLLERFADDDLRGRKRRAAERHLQACSACRGRLAEWEALFGGLASLAYFSPAEGFADRVLDRLARAPARAPVRAPAPAGWLPWIQAFPAWTRRLLPAAVAVALVWAAGLSGLFLWAARRLPVGPGEALTWALHQIRDGFWTLVVRVAASWNTAGLDVNLPWLIAFVASLTLLAVWGARALYRYTVTPAKVRLYA